jgi:hypothetical protein
VKLEWNVRMGMKNGMEGGYVLFLEHDGGYVVVSMGGCFLGLFWAVESVDSRLRLPRSRTLALA